MRNELCKLYEVYSPEADMTFIVEEVSNANNGIVISSEVKGFYHGVPMKNGKGISLYYGKLKAEY